ncbi:hypothetical protein DZF98_02725 [Clavibacter californiensis]|uniref:Uncharacterized protein n=1 Tax=Clavibacter californiensis TaxID=1401995 RepID=A0ABX9N845_9MICO|nr:hypothetical protein DZF98_02725 [Clavibacter californiensis]
MWFTFLQVGGRTVVVGILDESTFATRQDTLCGIAVHPDFPCADHWSGRRPPDAGYSEPGTVPLGAAAQPASS